MKKIILMLTLLGALFTLGSLNPLLAQNKTFWFAVPDANELHADRPVSFMITAGPQPTVVTISMPKNGQFVKLTRPLDPFQAWPIPYGGADIDLLENSINNSNAVTNKGILISSDNPISAYYEITGGGQREIFTLKGEKALGTEFYTPFQTAYKIIAAPAYGGNSYRQIHMVATEDNTLIEYTPTSNVYNSKGAVLLAGNTYKQTLHSGQTLMLRENVKNEGKMLMGTHIVTKDALNTGKVKKIAVTVYEDSVESQGQDPIGDQIVPVDMLGKSYIVVKGYTVMVANNNTQDHVYILATKNGTRITKDGVLQARILNAGDYETFPIGDKRSSPQHCVFETSEPAYCYHQSATLGEVGGALIPSMYSIVSQRISFDNKNSFDQNLPDNTNNSIFLVYRKSSKDSFWIKNGAADPQKLNLASQAIPNQLGGEWMYAKQLLTGFKGVTTITNDDGAFALGYFSSPNSTSLYGYLSNFGNFTFPEPVIYSCGSYLFDVGYAKEVTWTVPNPGDYPAADLKKSRLRATKSGTYKVKIDIDMGVPIEQEVYLKIQNFGGNYEIPVAAFVGEQKDYKVQLNTPVVADNKFNARYTWTIEGAGAGGTNLEVKYPKPGDANYGTGISNNLPSEVKNVKWTTPGKKKFTLRIENITAGCDTTITKDIIVHNYPDNVDDAHCGITPDPKEWGISRLFNPSTEEDKVFDMDVPLVGRLSKNADHISIITAGAKNIQSARFAVNLIIFNGSTGLRTKTLTVAVPFSAGFGSRSIADIDNNGKTEIVIAGTDGCVRCYDLTAPEGLVTPKWTSDPYTDNPDLYNSVNLMIGDVDGDGNAEVVVGDHIFNGQTGKLLLNMELIGKGKPFGTGSGHAISGAARPALAVLADMDEDGTLELVAGYNIYKITLGNKAGTGPTNKVDILRTVQNRAARPDVGDGFTTIADINMDGHLDVAVSRNANNKVYLYAWDGQTGKLLNDNVIELASTASGVMAPSIPFIGDIDGEIDPINGKKYPEICMLSYNRIDSYNYDRTTNQLKRFWKDPFVVYDRSGSTSLTMFDFNQDGINELVYRDEEHLRIINGSLKNHLNTNERVDAPYDLLKTTGGDDPNLCASYTMNEYPVIADVTGDGTANIVVLGKKNFIPNDIGYLFIFGAEKDALGRVANPWAPTRQVWNQYAYNAVNINNDMTVPRHQLNPSTEFPGEDGETMYPYNGFLTQQTTINKAGVQKYPTPDAQLEEANKISYSYNANTDVMTISNLIINNVGSATLNAPVKITVYKDQVLPDVNHRLIIHDHNTKIDKGERATISIAIPKFNSHLSITKLIIRINDGGDGKPYQPVCNTCGDNESGAFKDIVLDAVAWIDAYRKCETDKAQFKSATSLSGAEFAKEWLKPGSSAVWKTGASTEIASLTTNDIGQYTFEATNTTSKLSVTHVLPYLSVATKVMSWRSGAVDNNWNNINNWNTGTNSSASGTQLKSVPAGCTTVHLPAPNMSGTKTKYPSLLKDNDGTKQGSNWALYEQPAADSIIFHYGSELAYPHLLNYKRAQVQYNFGYYNTMSGLVNGALTNQNKEGVTSPALVRNQWHPVSAPLKKIVSGDFSFGGYPFTWQGVYSGFGGTGHIQSIDFTSNYFTNDTELTNTYNAISVKVANYQTGKGYNDHKHLQALKGILKIPYFENEGEAKQHPAHSYDPISKVSSLYYFDNVTLQQLGSPVGKVNRGSKNEAYRFVFENANNQIDKEGIVPTYKLKIKPEKGNKLVLIGNPFLSPINMARFYAANTGKIANQYHIYDRTQKKWNPYSCTVATNNVNSFEAFAVELINPNQEVTLFFPVEGANALTDPKFTGTIPRRLQIPGALAVKATTQTGLGGDYAELSLPNAQVSNISKLINQEGHATPEVFYIDETGDNYNLIHVYQQGLSEVGLGVKCSDTKSELTLSFDHVAEFGQLNNTHPILIDKLLGVEQDLTKNPSYKFRQHTVANAQGQYADKKRFVIRFQEAGTSQNNNNSDNLQVTYNNGYLSVKSVTTMDQIEVYSLSGQRLFATSTIGSLNYNQNLSLSAGSYIVKVIMVDKNTVSKKIIVQ